MTAIRRRGRLLFLAPLVPADRGNGLAMRVGFFLNAYSRNFDVDLAVFPLLSVPGAFTTFVRQRVRRIEIFPRPDIDSHFALIAAMTEPGAQIEAFRRYGRPSLASFAGEAARRALARWTAADLYDVVHVSRLYLASIAEPWTMGTPAGRPHFVIDCDEDDAKAHRRLAAVERRRDLPLGVAWAEAEADAFARLAHELLPHFDLVFSASAAEATSLSAYTRSVMVVPNIAPSSVRREQRRGRSGKTVLFVATMGYAPNDDGAHWLVKCVWPRLRRAFRSQLRLLLVGSNPSASLLRLGHRPDVVVTGRVRDVGPFYRIADLAVVPIRAGGGTRIKLLEAAAREIPIVSTTFGAAGTTFRHGRDLLLADSAEQFARACATVLRHPRYARTLAERARRRMVWDYDPELWARHVAGRVAELGGQRTSLSGKAMNRCRKS